MNDYEKKGMASSPTEHVTSRNVRKIAEVERAALEKRNLGERIADKFSAFIGSWTFIIGQTVILGGWIIINLLARAQHWDPYPFNFLNLALSIQVAYATPIIIMSQNYQSRLSQQRNHLDLQINLLSEQENTEMLHLLRLICERLDIDYKNRPEVPALVESDELTKMVQHIEKVVEGNPKNDENN